jgi:hypothetical protein
MIRNEKNTDGHAGDAAMDDAHFIEANKDGLAEFGRQSFVEHGRGAVFITRDRKHGSFCVTYVPSSQCEKAARLFGVVLNVVREYDVMAEVVVVVGRENRLEAAAVIGAEFKVISQRVNRPDAGEDVN